MADILRLIGNTPLARLSKVTKGLDGDVYVKCEYLNPSGSIKDRIALRMITEAEKEGRLRPGGTVLEQTTGNTGPALAFVGGVKGYKVRLIVPAQLSRDYDPADRIRIMKYFGAQVELLDLEPFRDLLRNLSKEEEAAAFVALGIKRCCELEQSDSCVWWANQLCNLNNPLAHRDTTGQEILTQLEGNLDAWVASIGTGGTLLGVANAVRAANPATKVVGVVPANDPRIAWAKSGAVHKFLESFGIPRMKFLTEIMLDQSLPDQTIPITDKDAREMADKLCREEGFFCGISSGANVLAAIKTAKRLGGGAKVVTVLVDRRDRYFSEHPNEYYVV